MANTEEIPCDYLSHIEEAPSFTTSGCGCVNKDHNGKPCECFMIKQDIRTLMAVGEFLINIIAGQKKAITLPGKRSKLYNMMDGAFQMFRHFKYYQCKCGPEEETFIPDSRVCDQKKLVLFPCSCPDLPKKRTILRIIRNDVYQRMKMVKTLHYKLLERNENIRAIIKKREKPNKYIIWNVNYHEGVHKLVKRYRILKAMNEDDVPNTHLIDKKKLMEHIGEHRILPTPLRKVLVMEELANKIAEKTKKVKNKVCPTSEKKRRSVTEQEKFKCKCKETEEKIKILENFKHLIAQLNPVIVGKEEPLVLSECEKESITIEQLIKARKQNKLQFTDGIFQNHKKTVQELLKQNELLEENEMLRNLIQTLLEHSKLLTVEIHQSEETKSVSSRYSNLNEELGAIKVLITFLKRYLKNSEEKREPFEVKLLLEHINEMLMNYVQDQKENLNRMEKSFPGFNKIIFDDQRQKDKIVKKICRDDVEKDYVALNSVEEPNNDLRGRLRQMLKILTKPHLHVVDGYPSSDQESSAEYEYSKKHVINKLQKLKKKEAKRLNNVDNWKKKRVDEKEEEELEETESFTEIEDSKIEYDPIKEAEMLNYLHVYPTDSIFHNTKNENKMNCMYKNFYTKTKNHAELAIIKIKKKAYSEGMKIISQPCRLEVKQPNLLYRKRLINELELEKGLERSNNYLKVQEELKKKLKKAYETEYSGECRCVAGMSKLRDITKDIKNIIMNPEKHNIKYIRGPEIANQNGLENAEKFLSKFPRRKKNYRENNSFIEQFEKKSLITDYDENCFKTAKQTSELEGTSTICWEVQLKKNERIIIQPERGMRVKVLSGGRTGLEPLYSEYVSKGMLDGAVLGSHLQGPVPCTILQAILELNSGQGVVIIILNDSDVMNFLFAIERAHKLGVEAELVIAKDDISEKQPLEWKYGQRGHSGIILQYKIAAGMAALGHNLAAITRVTQNIQVATIACHFSSYGCCIGSGISGTEGHLIPTLEAADILNEMLKMLINPESQRSIAPEPDTNMIILINQFMMITDEVYGIISTVTHRLTEAGAKVGRVYHGSFTSSLLKGFSITLVKDWNSELIQFLDVPSSCNHWPPHYSGAGNVVMGPTMAYKKPVVGAINASENILILMEIMDGIVRDATLSVKIIFETNENLAIGLRDICFNMRPEVDLNKLHSDRPYLFLRYVGNIFEQKFFWMGKLFQIFFLAAAQEFLRDSDFVITWRNWCMALKKGTQTLAAYTKFKSGQGTVIDFLEPVTETLCGTRKGWSPLPFLHQGLDKVKNVIGDGESNVGIMLLYIIFNNINQTLSKHMSHFKGEEWWKVKPSLRIMVVDPNKINKICYDEIPQELKEKIREKEREILLNSQPLNAIQEVSYDKITPLSIEFESLKVLENEFFRLGSIGEDNESKIELLSENQEMAEDLYYSMEYESENDNDQQEDNIG